MVDERPHNSIRPDLPEFTCKNWEPARGGWIALVECDKERPRQRDAVVGDVIVNGYVRKPRAWSSTLLMAPLRRACVSACCQWEIRSADVLQP